MKRKKYYIAINLISSVFILGTLFGCSNAAKNDLKTQSDISSKEISGNNTTDNKQIMEEQSRNAKETFAKLLQDKEWLCKNTDYGKRDDVTFLILDINQDGIPEMLLSYGNAGSEAEHAISVITYNSENNSPNVKKLSTASGGYEGYLSDEKVFLMEGSNGGVTRGTGYKIESSECEEAYSWEDNKSMANQEKYYKLNGEQVSEKEYNDFSAKVENANKSDFYSINNENIKKYLDVEATNKELTQDEAKQYLLNEDGNFIKKKEQTGDKLSDGSKVYRAGSLQYSQHYDFVTDDYYEFDILSSEGDTDYIYLVGKDTGAVYSMFNQGNAYAYEIQDNQIIKKLEWKDGKTSNDWRQN